MDGRSGRPAGDLVGAAERGGTVEQALRMVLERLSATECAVYILREAFDYPHRRIARVLGLGEPNVRQVAVRGRRRMAGAARETVDPRAHARLCEVFLAAARTGALAELETLLGQRTGQLATFTRPSGWPA